MQQLTFVRPGVLEWWDVPAPRLDSDLAAIVRPLAVARCDLDLAMIYGRAGLAAGPFAFGHEFVGEVLALGDAVQRVKPGDRVIVSFQISCGICGRCRQGFSASCEAAPPRAAYGMAPVSGHEFGGALSDEVLVPFADAMLRPAPTGLSLPALASAADNLPDGLRAVMGPLATNPGAEVLVVGGGAQSVGLYAAAAAVALGSRDVTYIDRDPVRLAAAGRAGAKLLEIDPAATLPRHQYPITVDASARPEGLVFAVRSTEPFGVCTSVGIYFEPATALPLSEMYWKGITFVTGRVNSAASLETTLSLIVDGRFDPLAAAPTRVVEWRDAREAFVEPGTKLVVVR